MHKFNERIRGFVCTVQVYTSSFEVAATPLVFLARDKAINLCTKPQSRKARYCLVTAQFTASTCNKEIEPGLKLSNIDIHLDR